MTGSYFSTVSSSAWSEQWSFVAESRPFEAAGFTAFSSESREFAEGETVSFDDFILDQGGHFDLLTNRFTCPRTGVYFVNYNLRR